MKKKEDFIGFSRHEYRPMLREKSELLLREILIKQKPKKVLEIGTFLGYSSYVILDTCEDAYLNTLEKNEQNANDAKLNLQDFGERANVICCDAFDFLREEVLQIESGISSEKYDLIFLDGPKGQYVKYLPYLKSLLNVNGTLIADDIMFYGLVNSQNKIEHKHRTIVNNLRKFLKMLNDDEDFKTVIYDFDDGISVSVKTN